MTEKEILRHIDDGANYYVSMFGRAEHMETVDRGFYSYVRPKGDVYGISLIYDVRIDGLPLSRKTELVREIKAMNMPIWLDLLASDELFMLMFDRPKCHGQTTFGEEDEIYMAMPLKEISPFSAAPLPGEKPEYTEQEGEIIRVKTDGEFAVWAKLCNDILAGGRQDIHPVYHYPLVQKGLMSCYLMYHHSVPVSVAAAMNNNGIASLEFVATVPEMRRHGFARAVCEKAVKDVIGDGARLITVRAANLAAGKLYEKLGFKAYNYAI